MLWITPLLLPVVAGIAAAAGLDTCPGYVAKDVVNTTNSLTASLTLAGDACNVYGTDIQDLKLLVEYQSGSRLHVKIYDAAEQVYQIPEEYLSLPSGGEGSSDDSPLLFSYVENPFSFAVQRRESGETLFNTSGSALIFESQYIRLRTSLPEDPFIYGLGDDADPFRRPTVNFSRTFWTRDSPFLPAGENLYGSHPIYIEMRDAVAHGVFLANSNGMDIKINRTADEGQYLEYNAIGGVFDFYFLAGTSPSDVSQQYTGVIGLPSEVSFWTYGFHNCRYGYRDVMTLAEVLLNYTNAGIPLETLWVDIDYMDLRRTWTLDPDRFPLHKMQELIGYLHDHNQHFIMMVDPPVSVNDSKSYQAGLDDDVYLKDSKGDTYWGVMWPGVSAWVDWFHPNAQKFWTNQVASFFDPKEGVEVDGIWIDMNDPANFCTFPCSDPVGFANQNGYPPNPPDVRTTWPPLPGFPDDFQPPQANAKRTPNVDAKPASNKPRPEPAQLPLRADGNHTGLPDRNLLDPPYRINNTQGVLSANTLRTDLVQYGQYTQYDTHNLFNFGMEKATRDALLARRPGERPFVISRSSFAGSGRITGHWTGDNWSSWQQYRLSIKQNMEFASIYQIPTVGADVCGFGRDTTETLCARWAVLGAWYPFYRNHNVIGARDQEFYRWPLVAEAARKAIKTRMQLLDYLYTAVHYQSVDGAPGTILPLFFVYPADEGVRENELQFFYGSSLLVSPVTEENATDVTLYLPRDTWYDFATGARVEGEGKSITVSNVSYSDIPVHVRGGAIVPMRVDGANSTAALRALDFFLLVAPDKDGKAQGRLFLDDGKSISPPATSEISFVYEAATNSLVVNGTFGYETSAKLDHVLLLGDSPGGTKVDVKKDFTGPFEVPLGGY